MPCDVRFVPVQPVARERLLTHLAEYAHSEAHPFRGEDVLIEAWDSAPWLGALVGHANQGWFFVSLLGVVPAARGCGVGTQLTHTVEALCRERVLIGLWLDTSSWQALGSYQRLLFSKVGLISDHPPGAAHISVAKRQDEGALSPGQAVL